MVTVERDMHTDGLPTAEKESITTSFTGNLRPFIWVHLPCALSSCVEKKREKKLDYYKGIPTLKI